MFTHDMLQQVFETHKNNVKYMQRLLQYWIISNGSNNKDIVIIAELVEKHCQNLAVIYTVPGDFCYASLFPPMSTEPARTKHSRMSNMHLIINDSRTLRLC